MAPEYNIRWLEFFKSYVPTIIFWVLSASLLALPDFSYSVAMIQSITLLIWSYLGHVIAHHISSEWPLNIINPHVYIHHNKSITMPRPVELSLEAVVNFLGFFIIIILQRALNLKLFSTTMVIGSALLYVGVHILDYSIFNNEDHKAHHEKNYCNYDPEFLDTLFNTRCDNTKPYKNIITEIPHAIIAFGLAYLLKLQFDLD